MFLKSLTLKGFKSFADTTTLDLKPGVTVVVGPNGSGKSNVVDAVAWVLGAQAPATVRSQKMDDVIFAGTEKRAALGRAEVSLTIDNASGSLPVDFSEVTITRRLFRNGDSQYAINGTTCRLLDIQELLSDSGVGHHQHVIISQGQLDSVLNARPEDRRSIIEEAAGVLKFRKRKEKAERRLRNTEANVTRLQDLLREVRRQLRPLEKQADAARRHGALVAELRDLRIASSGRELTLLTNDRAESAATRADLARTDREIKTELARLDTAVIGAEAQLSAHGGDDLGDLLVRYESLSERARGHMALLGERRSAIDIERSAFVDQAVIAAVEADAHRLRGELAELDAAAKVLEPGVEALAATEAQLTESRTTFAQRWGEGVPAPDGVAAEARGERSALAAEHERTERESELIASRLANLAERDEALSSQRRELQAELADTAAGEEPCVAALDAATEQRVAARLAHDATTEDLTELRNHLHGAQARVEALELALGEAHTKAGLDALGDFDGVLGALVDLVVIDEGWELAFEAAAGEALASIVVADHSVARAIIDRMAEADAGCAVLSPRRSAAANPPPVGRSVAAHVRSRTGSAGVEDILASLIGGAVSIDGGINPAIDAAIAHPDAVIVTPQGDRFAPTGWSLAVAGSGVTQAALDEATAEALRVSSRLDAAEQFRREAASALDVTLESVADATAALERIDNATAQASQKLQQLDQNRQHLEVEANGLRSQSDELNTRAASIKLKVADLDERLPALEAQESERVSEARAMSIARDQLESLAAEVGSRRTEIEVASAGIEQRRSVLSNRLAEAEQRLGEQQDQRLEFEQRRNALDRREALLAKLDDALRDRLELIDHGLESFRARRQRQSEQARTIAASLDGLRTERQMAETTLRELNERSHRAEIAESELNVRIETTSERIRAELDCNPRTAMDTPFPVELEHPQQRLRDLERELKIMGPINPLALEEFEELQERHEFIQGQLDDIRSTRRDLNKVIRSIDDEIVNVFSAAFADVSANFERLFSTLFPGGRGVLRLTDPANPLTTGIEIEAKPSGKNVKKLSLLSGGERSLTALAFLFGVFQSRPSPFYVMDEVEAALDDVNLQRFLELVAEFRNDAQLMIVSHQKRTMEAADVLYGITMQSGGSSKVVSEQVGGPINESLGAKPELAEALAS